MSKYNCSCSCSLNEEEDNMLEEVAVSNAMKKFAYNSVPVLRQTTQVEISCLKDAVADNKEDLQTCLDTCNEARLSTCLDDEGVPIPQTYCNDACVVSDRTDTDTTLNVSVDPATSFKYCTKGAVRGRCYPGEFSSCIREQCKTDTNCISNASSMAYTFCAESGGDISTTNESKVQVDLSDEKTKTTVTDLSDEETKTTVTVGSDEKNKSKYGLPEIISGLAVLVLVGWFGYLLYKKNKKKQE